ncbi:MAG TPA: hypothetical protein VE130_15705 [Nitrososphaeraceae archaeon]|jgi:hypothetical protein|nr:hypothetical protein [Nitrososphaeraceae archaeon]
MNIQYRNNFINKVPEGSGLARSLQPIDDIMAIVVGGNDLLYSGEYFILDK